MYNTLEIDSVTKRFGERVILSDIYIKCTTGDIIGLFGRNGTGKSTLLKIIFGCLAADNKFLRINDKIPQSPADCFRQISYLSQDSFLPSTLTVYELVILSLTKEDVAKFLEDAFLKPFLQTRINLLSGGELRYLEIKLLLSLPSAFKLLDEPFNGLSPLMVEIINDMIKTYSVTKGIILTDHDYRSVLNVSNRFLILTDGHLREIEDAEDLITWGYLKAAQT